MTTHTIAGAQVRLPHEANPPFGARRLFAAAGPALTQHRARFGPLPVLTHADELIGVLGEAGLRGRGGAGFPIGHKMAAITGRRPVVIANGAEGEPASDKDAVLLQHAPHLILDGLAAVAAALGSRETHLYAGASALPAIRHALQERRATGWGGPTVHLSEAPETFIAGEESAVINRIAGRAAVPVDRVVPVTDSGLRGRPTLVQNVETLAHVALIARYGARWFRSIGTPAEPGTMLVTLSGTAAPGVLEVPLGIPLADLLRDHTDLNAPDVRAVLLGGFHGAWIPGALTAQACLSRESLSPLRCDPRCRGGPRARSSRVRAATQCRYRHLPGAAERRPVRAVPQRFARPRGNPHAVGVPAAAAEHRPRGDPACCTRRRTRSLQASRWHRALHPLRPAHLH